MKQIICKVLFCLLSFNAFGTAQIPDILIYHGDTISLFSCPLDYYPDKELTSPKRLFGSTGCFFSACWRNYVATWTIEDNKLYLIKIRNACYPTDTKYVSASFQSGADSIGNEYADLELLFPDRFKNGKVAADWVNAKLISPKGKLLYYIHDGFESIYEKEIEFTFENGTLISTLELDNSKTKASKYTQDQKLLLEFIQNHIDYSNIPESKEKVRIIVSILNSNEEGKIDSVKILRGFNDIYDKEALRVVKSIPEWDLLYKHGKKFNVIWTVPVIFDKK